MLEDWLRTQIPFSYQRLFNLLSQPGTMPGTIVAATSDFYRYMWVRDAAFKMMQIALHLKSPGLTASERALYENAMQEYVEISRHQQQVADFGEPKFNPDGTPFTGPWVRPQLDGVSDRVVTLTAYALDRLARGDRTWVERYIYGDDPDAVTLRDLEYVKYTWRHLSGDIWEEIKAGEAEGEQTGGGHFFNRMSAWRAMLDGAKLARALGHEAKASEFEATARDIWREMPLFWNSRAGFIEAHVGKKPNLHDEKTDFADIQTMIAIDLFGPDHGDFSPADGKTLSNMQVLMDRFDAYPLNQARGYHDAKALGRYIQDQFFGGNPWILSIQYGAMHAYRAAAQLASEHHVHITVDSEKFYRKLMENTPFASSVRIDATFEASSPEYRAILNRLLERGDGFLQIVKDLSRPSGSNAEEAHRETGAPVGAEELGWNAASLLSGIWARNGALSGMDALIR